MGDFDEGVRRGFVQGEENAWDFGWGHGRMVL